MKTLEKLEALQKSELQNVKGGTTEATSQAALFGVDKNLKVGCSCSGLGDNLNYRKYCSCSDDGCSLHMKPVDPDLPYYPGY